MGIDVSRHKIPIAIIAVVMFASSSARAGRFELFIERFKGHSQAARQTEQTDCDSCPQQDEERAGYPSRIAPWARCFPNRKYSGYYVGGGAPLHGESSDCLRGERRRFHEGTFGLDYSPFYSRVQLRWFHRQR